MASKARACSTPHFPPTWPSRLWKSPAACKRKTAKSIWNWPPAQLSRAKTQARCAFTPGLRTCCRPMALCAPRRSQRPKVPTPMCKKPALSTTGWWPMRGANPRCVVVARATSKPCWRPATWAASAPTSTPCLWGCAARWACLHATCMAFAWCLRPLATKSCRATPPA